MGQSSSRESSWEPLEQQLNGMSEWIRSGRGLSPHIDLESLNQDSLMRDYWSYISENSSVQRLCTIKNLWTRFEADTLAHAHHQAVAQCARCNHLYCEHMYEDNMCDSLFVCTNCDFFLEPNPYNPLNSDLVAYYKLELP